MYYLGTVTAASGGYYNHVTGNSGIGIFNIPANVKALYLVPSATGLAFAMSVATGITAFMSAGNGAPLISAAAGGENPVNGPFQAISGSNVKVGIWNAVGGFISVRVYAAPTS